METVSCRAVIIKTGVPVETVCVCVCVCVCVFVNRRGRQVSCRGFSERTGLQDTHQELCASSTKTSM